MKQLTLLLLIITAGITASAQQYWQQQVDYSIDVTLNDAERTLDGFIKMNYHNNSPDTLSFIWIHCWPNAFKNDRTAFSEQLLTNGRTDFYFSEKQQKGYINRLDFRVDGQEARMEDHPRYIDIVKIILPIRLPPGRQIILSTPFHVQLPFNFSRGGYTSYTDPQTGRTYTGFQITQWYPKPAVYDKYGWHPIPYLDQGEFYSEFGSYDVRITAPRSYTIAATGELRDSLTLQEIAYPQATTVHNPAASKPVHHKTKPTAHTKPAAHTKPVQRPLPDPPALVATKTLHYQQNNIHDFAWFADRRFTTDHDTLTLPSGRTIQVYAYYTPSANKSWNKAIRYIKDAVRFRSALIGEYPYNVVTAVQTKAGSTGGMEYPTITAINTPDASPRSLDMTIEHEVGHNWFYGILASNERRYAWMDEGINTYYDTRYAAARYRPEKPGSWLQNKLPSDDEKWGLDVAYAEHSDQPISTTSEDFSETNYYLTAYAKTGYWLGLLADTLGTATFDSCMHEYFRKWAFRHPHPEDFASVIDQTSHRDNSRIFSLLDKKGPLTPPQHRQL
ncbi:MAG: M1 family metallopeptidase, partial [Bacteroidetes bacterium]|nr:M1 family metallopeptidase [Bacteroidota bacterium]